MEETAMIDFNDDEIELMWSQLSILVSDEEKTLFWEEFSLLEREYNDEIKTMVLA